jgi:hypothetical protein
VHRSYPECDSYVCEGCPRESTCDIKSDSEPHTYSIDARDPLDKLEGKVNGVRSDLDDLMAQFNVFHSQFEAILAAIHRAEEEYGREV